MNIKPRIEGLSEGGVERVQVGECVRGDAVEGQRVGWLVQVHSYSSGPGVGDRYVYYSAGARGGGRYFNAFVIVQGRVTFRRADQTPGLIITS